MLNAVRGGDEFWRDERVDDREQEQQGCNGVEWLDVDPRAKYFKERLTR